MFAFSWSKCIFGDLVSDRFSQSKRQNKKKKREKNIYGRNNWSLIIYTCTVIFIDRHANVENKSSNVVDILLNLMLLKILLSCKFGHCLARNRLGIFKLNYFISDIMGLYTKKEKFMRKSNKF